MSTYKSEQNYIVATLRTWNVKQYNLVIKNFPGIWHLITDPEKLTIEYIESINPKYIFFPHWSSRVPVNIINKYECVCFHETDVPFGRGGSPIQNLIENGHEETVVSALRMVDTLDAGPVYTKHRLSLLGLAEEIYLRSAMVISDSIKYIVSNEIVPTPQEGEVTIFKRRVPEQSKISPDFINLLSLFDHIRMLDAEQYPHAYIKYGNMLLEFSRPSLRSTKIEANVVITIDSKKER